MTTAVPRSRRINSSPSDCHGIEIKQRNSSTTALPIRNANHLKEKTSVSPSKPQSLDVISIPSDEINLRLYVNALYQILRLHITVKPSTRWMLLKVVVSFSISESGVVTQTDVSYSLVQEVPKS